MMLRAPILLVLCVPLLAQFDNLVTDDAGSAVYFSSSLRMRGTEQYEHSKLFVADPNGVRLHTQRARDYGPPDPLRQVSGYYSVEAATVSGDASLIGLVASRDCIGGSSCLGVPRFQTEIGPHQIRGRAVLSRNGRFAVSLYDGSIAPRATLMNVATGERREWWPGGPHVAPRPGQRRVSSNGTALLTRSPGFELVRMDGTSSISLPDLPLEAAIDDEGKTAIYESDGPNGTRKLVHVDLGTGELRHLATSGVAMQPALSGDGRTAAYLSMAGETVQVFAVNTDGTGARQLTSDPFSVAMFALSGNGKAIYAVSLVGGLFRVDIETGAAREILARTISLNGTDLRYAVAGSGYSVAGTGFADGVISAAPPLPYKLGGIELLLDGRPLPLQAVTPTAVFFQVPWDVAPGFRQRLDVRSEASSVFDSSPVYFPISEHPRPSFERLGPAHRLSMYGQPYPLAAHSGFESLVTHESPAKSSEAIHLYMTGLGPVDPPVETGAPAPATPFARMVAPFTCILVAAGSEQPAEVLFAGLAPGFTGYYQVTVRMPENLPDSQTDALLVCRLPAPGGAIASAPLPVAAR